MAISEEDVYCTLVMSDSYLPGAAVLAHSLRDNGTKKKLAVLVTLDTLRASTLTELKSLFDYVIPVDRIGNPNPSNLYLMNRGDLLYAFTKIGLWRQTQFRKIVYIDADVVALRAPDELFDLPHSFAAAPDVGWPDIFNTGVMVLSPHMGDYWALKTLAATGDTFDGADQGLLNQYYEHKNWHRLSFTYNTTPSANYQYEPAYRYYKSRISMVHFIGKEKPWMTTRTKHAAPGAFNELLYRWWSVYDAHFQAPVSDYASGRYSPASAVAQQVAEPETSGTTIVEPEPLVTTTEPDMAEPIYPAEELIKETVEPTPTVEQRKFSAPSMEWDATRAAPPSDARPEAANFPTQTYVFTEDKNLFRAPKAYPEPPKDMWYKVPESRPAPPEVRPPPIFPWEQRGETSKPSRVFAEDRVSPIASPPPEKESDSGSSTPITPSIKITSDDPWSSFESTNAWDQVKGIDHYIRALNKRTKSSGSVSQPSFSGTATTPSAVASTETPFERRESLILTDFPSEIDRPSLPVTPAPMRRPMFWGKERDSQGDLPSAEGVPDQADWDPNEKMEEFRRHSLIFAQGELKMPAGKSIPDRKMPDSAVNVPEVSSPTKEAPSGAKGVAFAEDAPAAAPEASSSSSDPKGVVFAEDAPVAAPLAASQTASGPTTSTPDVASPQPLRAGRVQFGAVDFAKEKGEEGREEIISPTATKP